MRPLPRIHLLHLATSILAIVASPLNLTSFFKILPERGEKWPDQTMAIAASGSLLLGLALFVVCYTELQRSAKALDDFLLPLDRRFYQLRWLVAAVGVVTTTCWSVAAIGSVALRLA